MDRQTDSRHGTRLGEAVSGEKEEEEWRWLYPEDLRLIGPLCSMPFTGFLHLVTVWSALGTRLGE